MTTVVKYGEITMYNVKTRRWRQDVLYDDSGTDVLGARFSLAFEGIIHAQRVPLEASTTYVTTGGGDPNSAVAAYTSIRKQLNRPRQRLRVLVGGQPMLDVSPSTVQLGESTDIDNGPKPRAVDVENIVANNAFRVRFEIDAAVGQCPVSRANMVLSNRWSVTEAMDNNFVTTRSIEGSLRLAVSREFFEAFPVGHQFKGLVFPILENGFRRDSMTFTSSEDGLNCRYAIVDRQVDHAAPWPATEMEVQHTEGTNDGIKLSAAIQVQLKAPPFVDKRLLIERAIQIADNRLEFLAQSSDPSQIITSAQITDYIGPQNMVTLSMQTLHTPTAPRAQLTHLRVNILGRPLVLNPLQSTGTGIPDDEIEGSEYDRTRSPLPRLYGYSPDGERRPGVLILLHAYLKPDGCTTDDFRSINKGIEGVSDDEEDRTRPPVVQEMPEGEVPETTDEDRYRDEAKSTVYTISKITSEYVTETMKVAMPISRIVPARNLQSPTNVVFDLSEPQSYRIIDIDVERVGSLPKVPEPFPVITDGTLRATLKKKNERVYPPTLTADGRYEVFRVEARYWYILNRPPLNDELLRIGSHHFATGLTNVFAPNQLYSSQLA